MDAEPEHGADRLTHSPMSGSGCLDRHEAAAYRAGMDSNDPIAQLHALAARLDQLTAHAQRLADENRSLRQQQEQLAGERAQLLAKNEQARSRVEAMITRLKSLEQNT